MSYRVEFILKLLRTTLSSKLRQIIIIIYNKYQWISSSRSNDLFLLRPISQTPQACTSLSTTVCSTTPKDCYILINIYNPIASKARPVNVVVDRSFPFPSAATPFPGSSRRLLRRSQRKFHRPEERRKNTAAGTRVVYRGVA